jgi:hypothetical protein
MDCQQQTGQQSEGEIPAGELTQVFPVVKKDMGGEQDHCQSEPKSSNGQRTRGFLSQTNPDGGSGNRSNPQGNNQQGGQWRVDHLFHEECNLFDLERVNKVLFS